MTTRGLFIALMRAACAAMLLAVPSVLAEDKPSTAALSVPVESGPPLSPPRIDDGARLIDFAVSNAIFILRHEIGHVLITSFELPVLGREEDAADILGTLWLLREGDEAAHRVLTDAVRGWSLSGNGMTAAGYQNADFYDVHALDIQRAYTILCLGLGQNRPAFLPLAEQMGMGADRRTTCRYDFRTADRSWNRVLAPYRRAEGEAMQRIDVIYEPPTPELRGIAEAMRERKVLEHIASQLAAAYKLPRPLRFRAAACNDENAYYDHRTGELLFCYEVAAYFGRQLERTLPRTEAKVGVGRVGAAMPMSERVISSR